MSRLAAPYRLVTRFPLILALLVLVGVGMPVTGPNAGMSARTQALGGQSADRAAGGGTATRTRSSVSRPERWLAGLKAPGIASARAAAAGPASGWRPARTDVPAVVLSGGSLPSPAPPGRALARTAGLPGGFHGDSSASRAPPTA